MPASARVLGVRIDRVTLDEAADLILEWVAARRAAGPPGDESAGPGLRLVVTPNPEIVMSARRNASLGAVLNRADLAVPDGVGVVWAARRSGLDLAARVTGYDLLSEVLRRGALRGLRVYFLGARPGVAEEAASRAAAASPGLIVAGAHHGYFPAARDRDMAREVAASGAELLVVGMGSPRQEMFVAEQEEILRPIVAMPVGGALDVLSGKVRRAPPWMARLGLEWLSRMLSQPSRWLRAPALVRFAFAVLVEERRGAAHRPPFGGNKDGGENKDGGGKGSKDGTA